MFSNTWRPRLPFRRRTWLLILAALLVWPVLSGIQGYQRAIAQTREATLRTNLFRIRDAIDTFHRDTGVYPITLEALVERRYLRKVPEDPVTNSAATWRAVAAGTAPGIRDVKSGAPGQAIDGSRLSDW